MTIIGVELDPVPLVLTRGRDFRWRFDHEDNDHKPVNFPPGQLFFELATGGAANGQQTVEVDRADGGTYTLTLGGSPTTALPFDAKSGVVKAALEKLPAVGAGNVSVTGTYYAQWIFTGSITGIVVTPQQQEGINLAVNKLYDTVQGITGTDIDFKFNNPGFELTITAKNSMDEGTLFNWLVNAASVNIAAVLHAISGVIGSTGLSVVSSFFAPKRIFTVDFGGKLTHQPVGAITGNIGALTGHRPEVVPTVVSAGCTGITQWQFVIAGSAATLKVESEEADKIVNRTRWQLVWLPAGEPAGGDPVARGLCKVQL